MGENDHQKSNWHLTTLPSKVAHITSHIVWPVTNHMAKLTAKKPGKHTEEREFQSTEVSMRSKYKCYHMVALYSHA